MRTLDEALHAAILRFWDDSGRTVYLHRIAIVGSGPALEMRVKDERVAVFTPAQVAVLRDALDVFLGDDPQYRAPRKAKFVRGTTNR